MKVNYDRKATGIFIYKLTVGSTFFCKRSAVDEIGLYMVIDRNSGVFLDSYRNNVMAVNLATGQIRAFSRAFKVEPVDAEVNLTKD